MKKNIFLIPLFCLLNANAQWVTDTSVNTLVSADSSIDCKSIGTSDGKTFVVYWKAVAAPINYELRIQLLDANGNQMLGPTGSLISNTIPMSTWTAIWKLEIDGANNLYVGVTGTNGANPAIVFKMNSLGATVWGSNGITLGSGFFPVMRPLSNGDVLLGYAPVLGGQSRIQRYTSAGIPVWPAPISVATPVATDTTIIADIYELSNQNFITVFHKKLGIIDSNLFAQRYHSNGTAQWASAIQLSNKITYSNNVYSSAQENDVIYYGYYGVSSSANIFSSSIVRLNADGVLPWGINGLDFDTSLTYNKMDIQIKTNSNSNFLWAICHYMNLGQTLSGEYVQKIDKLTGARLFTTTAKEVFPVNSNHIYHASHLKLVNDTPFFITKNGYDDGISPITLNITKLDNDGNFVWPGQFIPVATHNANKSRISFTEPVNGESVTVFTEQKGTEPLIYAQKTSAILSTDTFSLNNFILFPNPSKDSFSIEGVSSIQSVSIYNTIGQLVYFSSFTTDVTKTNISTSNWMSGVYIVTVEDENRAVNYKFLKQ